MEYYFSIATTSLSVLSVAIQRSLQFQGWGWFSTFLRYTILSLLLKEIQSLGGDGFLIKFALWSFFLNFPPGQKTFYYSGPLKQSHYCGSVGSVRGTLVLIVFFCIFF